MKLAFSIPSKSKNKPPKPSQIHHQNNSNEDEISKEYVTQFDPTQTLTSKSPTLIIPPKENEWRPYKKMKNLDLPLQSATDDSALRFVVETHTGDVDDKISYGLNIREKESGEGGDGVNGDKGEVRGSETENMILDKLRCDLKRLPEDSGFADFDEVPVEGFGAALLAGYGWKEGRGVGRNAKEDVKVKQYHKRTAKEGLGFFFNGIQASAAVSAGEKPREKSRDRDGNGDGLKDKDRSRDRESNGDGFFVGKDVRVVAGGYDVVGLKGRIVKRSDGDQVVLKLANGEEEVKLLVSDIADLGSKEEEKCLRKLKELRIRQKKQSKDRDDEKQSTVRRENVKRDTGELKVCKQQGEPWLTNHIRVRIISEDLKGGKFFRKKGEVVDVVGPYTCDIKMDESRELVQGVDQDLLETALPRHGGNVLVLYGKHKGAYGNMVERDLDREVAVVQDSDTHELLTVKLEQIAEYIGDPSYIGY